MMKAKARASMMRGGGSKGIRGSDDVEITYSSEVGVVRREGGEGGGGGDGSSFSPSKQSPTLSKISPQHRLTRSFSSPMSSLLPGTTLLYYYNYYYNLSSRR